MWFMEGFIRPGTDPGNWASRAGLTALGVVPTGPAEMSLYKQAHYSQPSCHLLRYTLRTDGFASVNAPYTGGELLTRSLEIIGDEIERPVYWQGGGELGALTGQPVRLRFVMKDADLYSLRFQ
jgi:hypothetical protein